MNRDYAIEVINSLYPPDSEFPDTAAIGQELLEQARNEVNGWQTEPTEVLIRLAELCIQKENEELQGII